MIPSRRTVLGASGAAGMAVALPTRGETLGGAPPVRDYESAAWLQAVLERYAGFGIKASGGAGDLACGAWLEGELSRLGYACTRQVFEAPFFETRTGSLQCGEVQAVVAPQAIVVPTGPHGLTAPLRLADSRTDLAGAIALVVLPSKRWVSLADPQVALPVTDAFRRGAVAAVVVTTGVTRELIALNVSTRRPGFDRPVALLAPKDSTPFASAAAEGRSATLVLDGRGEHRPAFNLIARLDRGAGKTLILSTPRSGWFGCVAERGSGLAVWLALAHDLTASRGVNLELLCTSGHEYEYLGGEIYLESGRPPPPSVTRLWCHIGASAAARDWHELGALRPLPSADAQRVLTASPDILQRVRAAFRGIGGLESTYPADRASAGGELTNVLAAGYRTVIGLYGGHRYFHTPVDDLRCTSGELVQPVAAAFRTAIHACLMG